MESEFVPFYLAVRLKELGFDEMCFGVYIDGKFEPRYKSRNSKFNPNKKLDKRNSIFCTSPLWQQVSDWFSEEYRINNFTHRYIDGQWCFEIFRDDFSVCWDMYFSTKEEARKACLEKLIELAENETV